MNEITVFLKPTYGGDKFPCEIEPSQSVKELKEVVASQSSPQVAVEDQRLIYKGQVLKDERTVESYGKTVSTFFTLPKSLTSDTRDVDTGQSVHRSAGGARYPPSSTASRPGIEVRDIQKRGALQSSHFHSVGAYHSTSWPLSA